MSDRYSGRAISLRAKLLELARREGENFQALLARYATERVIYRLAKSPWSDRFVLKGAWLFEVWRIVRRSTRDVDFLAYRGATPETIEEIFRSILEQPVEDDGVRFSLGEIRVQETRGEAAYPGVRVRLPGDLAGAKFVVQIDLGFGDAVVEDPVVVRIPTLLDLPEPEVRAYSVEVAIAEKAEALVRFGSRNTRYKDFHDIAVLGDEAAIDGPKLSAQLSATFERRGTEIPQRMPEALQDEFAESEERQREWRAFQARAETSDDLTLAQTVERVRALLWPVMESLGAGETVGSDWNADTGWVDS